MYQLDNISNYKSHRFVIYVLFKIKNSHHDKINIFLISPRILNINIYELLLIIIYYIIL